MRLRSSSLPLLLLLLLLLAAAPLSTVCLAVENVEDAVYGDLDSAEEGDEDVDLDAEDAEKFLVKTNVCYDDLGCFSITGKYFSLIHRPVVVVPQPPDVIGTEFLLFTRLNPASPAKLEYNYADSVLRSHFSNRRPTKLVIHGFLGKGLLSWMNHIRQAMLKRVDCNMIQVGWSGGAVNLYNQATSNTRVVGAIVARMLRWMHSRFGVKPDNVHVIGFSLGGQIAGYVGRRLRESGTPLGRITGLDPAGPYFEGTDPDVRLDATDAKFVDVVHTDGALWRVGLPLLNGGFGTQSPVGHVDFFVNGGHHQPGCSSLSACDHSRAPQLYIDSLEALGSRDYVAFPCDSYDRFLAGECGSRCPPGGCPTLGLAADRHRDRFTSSPPPHRHYLLTGSSAPYSQVHYHVALQLSSSSPSGRSGGLHIRLNSGSRECGPKKLAGDERSLSPGSLQRGVFGCSGWNDLASSEPNELRIRWTDESTFGSWLGYRIKVDSVVLTEMFSGRAFRFCGFGAFKGDDWTGGSRC